MTERGRGLAADSVLARKNGSQYKTKSSPWNDTENDRAWSSETRLAVAMARRNKAFLVLSKKDALARGSNGGPERNCKTLSKSQGVGGKKRSRSRYLKRPNEVFKNRRRDLRKRKFENR